jgi:site-specific DNA-methyltransferase (adenine-specific)
LKFPDDYLIPGIEPYHVEEAGIIYCGDCRDILPHLPKVDLCLTDPPYNIGSPQRITDMRTKKKRLIGGDFGCFDNGAITPPDWFAVMPNLVLSFYDARNINKLINAAEDNNYEIIQDFHWCKCNPPVPMRAVGFSWAVETGYAFRKIGTKHKYNITAGISPNYFIDSLCAGGERTSHPTQKKYSVMAWLMRHWSFNGDIILDPFLGSGTTAVAAKELGRRFIGVEISLDYCKIAKKRLRQGVLDFNQGETA